ncbi:MAG: VWA domain-containing protein [Pseudomonadota bacterium]
MSKELDTLGSLFDKQDEIRARPDAKAKAISAAMDAFEGEKISQSSQGMEDEERLNQQGGRKQPLSKWRHAMNTLNSKWTYGLAGSASVAVLAMMIVGPNVTELLPQTKKPAPAEVTQMNLSDSEASQAVESAPEFAEEAEADTDGLLSLRIRQESTLQDIAAKPTAKPAIAAKQKRVQSLGHQQSLVAQGAYNTTAGYAKIAPAPIVPDISAPQYEDQGRDKFEKIETNPVKVVKENPVSTFSVDVDTASYAFMRSSLNNNALPQKNAVRVEELINYFDYAYEAPKDKTEPFKANVEIMPTPWNKGTKIMSIGIKGYELPKTDLPGSNLVFLIDTSGSMEAPNKLPLLRNSFKLLLSSLKPEDTVSIVTYAGSAGTALEPTKVSDKRKILAALDNLHAGGSTAGAEGIRQAYTLAEANKIEGGVNRVILATDGDFNVGISNTEELKSYIERKRETGVTLSVLGFGQGNYNDQLMQALAQNGNGNASYIDTLSEARKVLVEESGSTLFTIAKDVKLQVEFNPALVSEYRLIGYETRALKREDFNNDKVDAGDIGSGHSVTALYEITPVDSDAKLVDDLRYDDGEVQNTGSSNEYGFLKIRYKLPDSDKSTLVTKPITAADEVPLIGKANDDMRFATSVAAFGQILRGGEYTGDYSFDDVIDLAQSGRGNDGFGYRSEFINLVRLAKSAAALEPLKQ